MLGVLQRVGGLLASIALGCLCGFAFHDRIEAIVTPSGEIRGASTQAGTICTVWVRRAAPAGVLVEGPCAVAFSAVSDLGGVAWTKDGVVGCRFDYLDTADMISISGCNPAEAGIAFRRADPTDRHFNR